MDFTVLMSVYGKDDPTYFEKALKSISIDQDVQPSQIVIVEDGPVNQKIEDVIVKIQSLAQGIDFTIKKNKKNRGLAASLNDGLKECKYEWIARMDSDDIATKDRFKKQLEFIMNNPNLEVLGGAIAEFRDVPGDIKSERHVGRTMQDIIDMSKTRTPMNHVSVMYSKNAIHKVGGYSENFGKLEDYKLWIDMIANNTIMANLDEVIVYVRIGNGFLERRSDKKEIRDWDMLQDYLIKQHIIGRFKSIRNKISIRAFIYMPLWMKSFVYRFLLRK